MKNLFLSNGFKQPSYLNAQSIRANFTIYSVIYGLLLGLLLSCLQLSFGQNSIHTVAANETLFAIAQRYNTSVDDIVATNKLVGKTIYVGQRLHLPVANTEPVQLVQSSSNELPITVARQGFYVTVAPGESLLGIALRYGVPIGEIAVVNNIDDVTNIPVGSSLFIPAVKTLPADQITPVVTQAINTPINAPSAQQLQTVAQSSGVQNIQIVSTRHKIGGGSSNVSSSNVGSSNAPVTAAVPNGPQVSIGVAPAPVEVPVQSVGTANNAPTAIQPVQPVGGFVPQDQSPKQQLLQQQMVLLRKSGPQLAIFQPPLQEFAWPLGIKGRISSNYGSRKLAITSNRFHYGLDLAAATGTEVKASKSGVVKEASWIGGYGNAVYIDHPDGTQTRYAHMSKLNVAEGDSVAQGEVIGKVGSTGVSTGPHLHFEIRVKGYAVDPLEYVVQP